MADRPTLTLYGCPNSRSLRVAWALEEADADYAYHAVDLFRGEGREAPLLTLNPSGKVPVLVTEDGQISESGAILIWPAERYPRARLLPMRDDGSARAKCLQWVFFTVTELEQPLWTIAKHRFVLPSARRCPQVEPTACWEFEGAAKRLAGQLEGHDFICGAHFSIADILACHTLAWARSARIAHGFPILDTYLDTHLQRPALKRAQAREGRL